MDARPKFRIDKETIPPTVWLQCSNCEKDIRMIGIDEEISIRHGYYCEECDDGAIHMNPPKPIKKE